MFVAQWGRGSVIVGRIGFHMKVRNVYIAGGIVYVLAAVFSAGYYQFDEHFQILEFAGLKLGLTEPGNLPWEFHEQIRPTIQPALAVLVANLLGVVGIKSPFTIAMFLRCLSAAVSFFSVHLLYQAYSRQIKDAVLRNWLLLLSFLLWFAVFTNVRYSSENWSGTVFTIAFAWYLLKHPRVVWSYFLLGFVLGLSFLFRYQVGFLIAGFWMWLVLVERVKVVNWLSVVAGIVIAVGAGVLIDRWFYGGWTLSTWNYFEHNILMGRVSAFGTSPWWEYLKLTFIKAVPPFSLVFIGSVLAVFVFRRKDPLTWTVLPFVLAHSLIGHKELRFLFPIIAFLAVFVVKAVELAQGRWSGRFRSALGSRMFVKAFWITNAVLLVFAALVPADHQISLYKRVYTDYETPITLYCAEGNPYHRILDVHFYRREGLTVEELSSGELPDFNAARQCLVVTKHPVDSLKIEGETSLIYTTLPEWIKAFNFNNWIERTKFWYVYEVSSPS